MWAMKASHERMKTLKNVSVEMTETCLEETEKNQGELEIKMEACLEEMLVGIVGYWRTDIGTGIWLYVASIGDSEDNIK